MKTEPLVLTIFGDECCETTLEDFEAAAKAIHQKAVREAEKSGLPSTLGAGIEDQIRVINAESESAREEAP